MIPLKHEQSARRKTKTIHSENHFFPYIYSFRVDFAWQSVVRRHRKLTIQSAGSESGNMKTPAAKQKLIRWKKNHTQYEFDRLRIRLMWKISDLMAFATQFLAKFMHTQSGHTYCFQRLAFLWKTIAVWMRKIEFYRWCTLWTRRQSPDHHLLLNEIMWHLAIDMTWLIKFERAQRHPLDSYGNRYVSKFGRCRCRSRCRSRCHTIRTISMIFCFP